MTLNKVAVTEPTIGWCYKFFFKIYFSAAKAVGKLTNEKRQAADQTVKGRYVYIFRKGTAFHHQCVTN